MALITNESEQGSFLSFSGMIWYIFETQQLFSGKLENQVEATVRVSLEREPLLPVVPVCLRPPEAHGFPREL